MGATINFRANLKKKWFYSENKIRKIEDNVEETSIL